MGGDRPGPRSSPWHPSRRSSSRTPAPCSEARKRTRDPAYPRRCGRRWCADSGRRAEMPPALRPDSSRSGADGYAEVPPDPLHRRTELLGAAREPAPRTHGVRVDRAVGRAQPLRPGLAAYVCVRDRCSMFRTSAVRSRRRGSHPEPSGRPIRNGPLTELRFTASGRCSMTLPVSYWTSCACPDTRSPGSRS